MRINKFISETGTCSRRETNRLIKAGRITVNGELCEEGRMIGADDVVLIDGKPLQTKPTPIYILLNKPVGITCTAASTVEGNIIDFINYPERIFPVGRLDKASQGLIMMTNDGDIVNKMMRSEYGHEKEYIVTVDKPYDEDFIMRMSCEMEIRGVKIKPCKVVPVSEDIFRIMLTQGLNRQIRRMCKNLGYTVTRLERIRIMNLPLDIEVGSWRHVGADELDVLMEQLKEEATLR